MKNEYCAGFIDAEGCIGVAKGLIYKNNPSYYEYVAIGNTNKNILQLFKEKFGGSICKNKITKEGHKQMHLWRVSSKLANNVIEEISPYLIIKKEQAKLCLLLRDDIIKQNYAKPTKERIYFREELYKKIKKLNHRKRKKEFVDDFTYSKTSEPYLAGIIDGDGCLMITRNKNKKDYKEIIAIKMIDYNILDIFKKAFGGSIREIKKEGKFGEFRKNDIYHYVIKTKSVYMMLRFHLYPHLILKKEEAKNLILFREMLYNKGMDRDKKDIKKEELYLKIRELKK